MDVFALALAVSFRNVSLGVFSIFDSLKLHFDWMLCYSSVSESTVTVDTAVPVTDPLRTNAPTFTPIASSNAGHPSVNPPAVSTPYTSNVAPVHRDALIPPTPVASTDSAADPALARGPDGQYIDPIRADQALARLRIRGLVVDAINKQQRPRVSNEGQQPSLPSQPTASTPESAPAIGPAPSAWASSSKFDKYLSEGVSFLRRVVSTPVQPASNYEALRDLLAPELTLEMPLLISSNPRAPKGPHPPEKPMRETDPVPDLKRYASHFSPVPASDATWKSTVREEDVVMITASTGSFSAGVHEIAASLQYWEPDRLLIVYDLDMTATQRSAIKLLCNVVLMPPLREMYPQLSHQIFFPRSYAWKAMCIYDALTRWPAVFWSDVRSILTAPLQPLASLLVKHGYVMMKGQDEDASRRIYQGTAAALGVQSSWFKDLPSFSGNTQAYVRNGPLQDVMLRYTECSVKVNTCMAPQVSICMCVGI